MGVDLKKKPWFKYWPNEVPKSLEYPIIPLHQLLSKAASENPNKVAVVSSTYRMTYKDLNTVSDKFASALVESGVKKGDRVGIFLPNVPQFIIAYYGILKAGATLTAMSPLHREREVEHQLVDSGAETVIVLDSLLPIVDAVWEKTKVRLAIVVNGDENASNFPTSITQLKKSNVIDFPSFLMSDTRLPKMKINPTEDIAALQYTGGTTGTAKAAMLTHFNLVSNAVAFAAWIQGTVGETFLTALPLYHIYGMTTSLNVPVVLAAKMVLIPRFEILKVLSNIQQHKITVFCGVPTMYQTLISSPDLTKYDLTSIRVCISGASPLPPQVQRKFMEATHGLLAEGYGLTEASPVTHCSPVDITLRTVRVGSIGLPLPDTEARIVDVETGTKTLKTGETGELAVRGHQIMRGYWHNSQETALVLRDGWLLTGDIAYMDSDGYFYVTDRKKDLIKYKDYSVFPREIEDALYEHPAVKLCAVVGKPDPVVGETPKAYVVLKDGAEVSDQELMVFVNGKIAPYKAIREVEFRTDLPLSGAGKVLKRALR